MKRYLTVNEWKIVEEHWEPALLRISESIFSLGNGRMGLRGNFEEGFTGDSLQGSYYAGIYYPDKTKVGWWKNGYPEYFAKVLNGTNWIALPMRWNGTPIDLHTIAPSSYRQELDMQHGLLSRQFTLDMPDGSRLSLRFERFCSMVVKEAGFTRMHFEVLNGTGTLEISPTLDLDVKNEDSNYEEKFWENGEESVALPYPWVKARTRKSHFSLMSSMAIEDELNGEALDSAWQGNTSDKKISLTRSIKLIAGDRYSLTKYTAHINSLYCKEESFVEKAAAVLDQISSQGFDRAFQDHREWWAAKWRDGDIIIDGDPESQQGIRYNIFQLHQTYTGDDERLNIGPKGFTGEKYGGSTYWDTEAYCIPFFLSTSTQEVPRNLLIYRHNHLNKAIENARKLGFQHGAALYPMVTMNGEECHNEWEITFEEIHRNGAIAYAIFDYIRYTGDVGYLAEYGLDVLIGISRFWAQRFNWSEDKKAFVMLGVTGPNEYENNVNNNWYTNYIARWCLNYTLESMAYVREHHPDRWAQIAQQADWHLEESTAWTRIIEKVYLPADQNRGVFLQQDGFLDKVLMPVSSLPEQERPLNQNWSWDRILRSCFIKQADVLQGMFLFDDHFTREEHVMNFDFYEPMTVHESSLSPCIHAIQACRINRVEKAYEMYLRTSRLDLDDYNNDTEDGLHITSMAGTWMSVVKGFGGMRVSEGHLHFDPVLPEAWIGLSFHLLFREHRLTVNISRGGLNVINYGTTPLEIFIKGEKRRIDPVQIKDPVI